MNKPILLFLFLAFGISWGIDINFPPGETPQWANLTRMWGPGIAAFLTGWWYKIPVVSSKFGLKRPAYLLAGYLLPIVYAVPVYLAIWLFGFAGFNSGYQNNFLSLFAVNQAPYLLTALGVELGWRGFLYPQLCKYNNHFMAALYTGVTCALWLYPLIINHYHQGPPLWYLLACFSLMILSMSFLMAWLRDRSESIWPGVLMLASHQFYIQVMLNNLTNPSGSRAFLYGETGIGLALTTFIIACLIWIKHGQPGNRQVIIQA